MSRHPADRQREKVIRQFAETPVEAFLGKEATADVPGIIGVRCLKASTAKVFDVVRCNASGKVFQHYKSDPRIRRLYVCYKAGEDGPNRAKPIIYCVNQVHRVWQRIGSRDVDLEFPADSPLHGRPLGSAEAEKAFLARWWTAFDRLCQEQGIAERFAVNQGAVVEKIDGTHLQVRNFDKNETWMAADTFCDIGRVHRSPLRFAAERMKPAAGDA
jgi:hypothetical protein